jgi:hypothetical protein
MTLAPEEFMRRFLLHVLPPGFHRIRHYGLLANANRTSSLALARQLLCAPTQHSEQAHNEDSSVAPPVFFCRHCGHVMIVLHTFRRGESIRAPPGAHDR